MDIPTWNYYILSKRKGITIVCKVLPGPTLLYSSPTALPFPPWQSVQSDSSTGGMCELSCLCTWWLHLFPQLIPLPLFASLVKYHFLRETTLDHAIQKLNIWLSSMLCFFRALIHFSCSIICICLFFVFLSRPRPPSSKRLLLLYLKPLNKCSYMVGIQFRFF